MEDKPDANEALNLMVAYYQKHTFRAIFHLFIVLFTGGIWLSWFLGFWIWTILGFKDIEGMRELRDA